MLTRATLHRLAFLSDQLIGKGFTQYADEIDRQFPAAGIKLKKGPWTLEEDRKLIDKVQEGLSLNVLVYVLRRDRFAIRERIRFLNRILAQYPSIEAFYEREAQTF